MFQSTPSAREGDPTETPYALPVRVSIHAFREGRRHYRRRWISDITRVSIHAFREGRRLHTIVVPSHTRQFQSTPSAREGDASSSEPITYKKFQSTPSAREGDQPLPRDTKLQSRFNPRLPRGKATIDWSQCNVAGSFQSTPSAREGDKEVI